jgi:hypothetical protein
MCAIEPKFFCLPSHSVCTLLDLRHLYAMTYGSRHLNDHLAPLSSSSGEIRPSHFFSRDSHIASSSRGAAREGGGTAALGTDLACARSGSRDEPSPARIRASRFGKCDATMAWSLSPKPVCLDVVQGRQAKFFTVGQDHDMYLKPYFWICCSKGKRP